MTRPYIDVLHAIELMECCCKYEQHMDFPLDTFKFYCRYIVDWNAANYQLGTHEPDMDMIKYFWHVMHWLHDNVDMLKEAYEACASLHDMDANVVVAPYITTSNGEPAVDSLPILKAEYEYLDPDYQLIHPLPVHYIALIDLTNIVADFYHRYYKLYATDFMLTVDDSYDDKCKEAINALKPNPNYIPKE